MKITTGMLTAAIVAAALVATPVLARRGQLTVTGTITAGSDGGNDLADVNVINNVYVEDLIPGSIFGTIGSLVGKSVVFHLLYDTNAAAMPVSVGGSFDDQSGEWAYTLMPTVTVGGVVHDFIETVPGTFLNAATAKVGLVDGAPDGVTGSFTSFTYSGDVISDYRSNAFDFSAILPAGFVSTDAIFPGGIVEPHYGFAHGHAVGSGSFLLSRQTCFFTCSSKVATASFDVDLVAFAAIPEPATWTLMLIAFAATGTMLRRERARAAA